jgi:expansin (peptidoglycan-binding protein)
MWTPPSVATNYAALNDVQWSNLAHCGRCAKVRCIDARCKSRDSEIVTIVDRCPECKHGDLDLSPSVWKTITGVDPSRLAIEWSFIDCPVSGPLNMCLKTGSSPYWMAFQPSNIVTGVTSMTVNGFATSVMDSAYYFLVDMKGWQVPMTDLHVDITFIDGSVAHETIDALDAAACTNGYREVPEGNLNRNYDYGFDIIEVSQDRSTVLFWVNFCALTAVSMVVIVLFQKSLELSQAQWL